MSKDIKAFPSKEYAATNDPDTMAEVHNCGMLLRDYFAAKALHALALECSSISELALEAYRIADAMMKARE